MINRVIVWDNNGTIMGSVDPNDPTRKIMPNVKRVMGTEGAFNIICSGCKTAESELQDFDSELIIAKFTSLMNELPLEAAVFSPARGGAECWVLIKRDINNLEVRKAHEDPRYAQLVGQFKKPGTGMFVVIRDLVAELTSVEMNGENSTMIGDSWHDMVAAYDVGLPFVHAKAIHDLPEDANYSDCILPSQKQSGGCC